LEDFKLKLTADGEFDEIGAENRSGIFAQHFSTDVYEYSNTNRSVYVKPTENILVQGDSYTTGSIYLKPTIAKETDVTIYWKILARDFKDSGKLTVKIAPLYHRVVNTNFVESAAEEEEQISFSLIERPGQRHPLDNKVNFSDNESDYTFTED